MKNLNSILFGVMLIMFSVFLAVPKVHAQDFAGQLGTTVTHTNAQADTQSVTIAKSRTAITFKYDYTVTSGTAAGTIVLQARITDPTTAEQWTTLNSFTMSNAASVTNSYTMTGNNYVYYRVITTTSGTSVTVHNKWLLYRQFYPLQ
jgi:Tfp pilus assembly protein PilW